MPELIERPDGVLALDVGNDPAFTSAQRLGFRRFAVGLDVGGAGDDPSAIVVCKAERRPYLTGRGNEQALTPLQLTVMYTETARIAEGVDVVTWASELLRKLPLPHRFILDASALGAPLVSMFEAAKVPVVGATFTSGASFTRVSPSRLRVAKGLAFEELSRSFETGQLRIAHDLPQAEQLKREIMTVEVVVTSAGNSVIKQGGRGHHADLVSALALCVMLETHMPVTEVASTRLRGYFG